MKAIILILACVFALIGALATPIAIGLGVYEWAASDVEFKFALWYAVKAWATMLLIGFGVGIPMYAWHEIKY